ncbi:hypothetical protein BIW11_04776, partial [Tropilaelaps mercedesae]
RGASPRCAASTENAQGTASSDKAIEEADPDPTSFISAQEARERAKLKSDAELGISPPSACVRRQRGRLVSEDGAWDPTATPMQQSTTGPTPMIRHSGPGAHPSPRPQSEYLERTPDPEMLAVVLQPMHHAKARPKVIQPSPTVTAKPVPPTSGGDLARKVVSSTLATKTQKAPAASAKKRHSRLKIAAAHTSSHIFTVFLSCKHVGFSE